MYPPDRLLLHRSIRPQSNALFMTYTLRLSMGKRAPVALLLVCTVWALNAHAVQDDDAPTKEARARLEASQLSDSERTQSWQWQLNETEWQRYKTLMLGIRGKLSPDISPIEALGIHAQSEDERQRYAEMWAKALREDTERVLAFQHAYDDAWKQLYGNEPLIDLSRLAPRRSAALLQPGDRILFFAASNCAACGPALETVLAKIQRTPRLGLDVYLIDSGNDDTKVRAWAKEHRVPPELVRNRTVTLNHDSGAIARLSGFTGTIPYIARRRGAQLTRIDPPMLGPQ